MVSTSLGRFRAKEDEGEKSMMSRMDGRGGKDRPCLFVWCSSIYLGVEE